ELDPGRRPEPQVRLRGIARWIRPQALGCEWRRGPRLARPCHAPAAARKARDLAELLARARADRDGRLHRRSAALPGARRRHQCGDRAHRARLELALLERPPAAEPEALPAEQLGD